MFCCKTRWQMFLLVSGYHVGAHLDGHQHGVSIHLSQSINLGKTFLCISPLTKIAIRFFHQSHNTVHFGGLFTLKQWIFSSLKHDPVPRENKLYCFYVKNPPKRIAFMGS